MTGMSHGPKPDFELKDETFNDSAKECSSRGSRLNIVMIRKMPVMVQVSGLVGVTTSNGE